MTVLKILLLTTLLSFEWTPRQSKITQILIIYSDHGVDRGFALTKEYFWLSNPKECLKVVDEPNLKLFESGIKSLRKVNFGIATDVAIVRKHNRITVDTIYTNRFFTEWDINGQTFELIADGVNPFEKFKHISYR